MRLIGLCLLVGVCCLGWGAPAVQAQGAIVWSKSMEDATLQAQRDRKLMMVDLYTDWCVRCKQLDADTFTDKKVIQVSGDFVPVKLNAEKEGRKLAEKYSVHGYPSILFLAPSASGKKPPELVGSILYYLPPGAFAERLNLIEQSYQDFPGLEARFDANPRDLEAIGRLVPIYYMRLAGKRAVALLAEGMKLDPENMQGHLTKAYCAVADQYQDAQQTDKAIALYTQAAATGADPEDKCYAYYNIALCSAQQRRFPKAIAFLNNVIDMPNASEEDREQARQSRIQFQDLMTRSPARSKDKTRDAPASP